MAHSGTPLPKAKCSMFGKHVSGELSLCVPKTKWCFVQCNYIVLEGVGYSSDEVDHMVSHVIYCSGKDGTATLDPHADRQPKDMKVLFDAIIDRIPGPLIEDSFNNNFQMYIRQ